MGFYNYNKSGVGIAKNSEKKTGAKLFFDILWRKIWNIFQLNMIFWLFTLPLMTVPMALSIKNTLISEIIVVLLIVAFVVLIGPAMAGMSRVMRMFIIEKHCFVFSDFMKGFRTNFKKACIIGILDCVAVLSAIGSIKIYPALSVEYGSKLMYIPMVIALSIALVFLMMNFYIYLMLVATNLSMKNLLKNSFALAFVAIKSNFITLLFIVLLVGIMALLFLFLTPVFIFVFPFFPAALICFITTFNCYPVIQKYIIDPYYTSIGQVNPEHINAAELSDEETIFEDMGGKEQPIDNRKKGKGKRIS